MATYYSQGSDVWSTLANWNTNSGGGGSSPASVADMDNNTFIIQAGHTVTLDVDMSGFSNGIAGLSIIGGVTPGMLICKYNTDGTYYIKIKTGTTLAGTTSTNRGRLLGNSDGVWGNTGDLPFGRQFIIDLQGTAKIDASNLDIQLYDTEPTYTSVSTCGSIKSVSSINTSTDVITMGSAHGWAANTPVCIRSSGTLPAPLQPDTVYYVTSPSGSDLKLAFYSSGPLVDLTDAGSGTIEIYDGHSNTSTAVMNVLTDITADTQWVTGTALILVDSNAPENYDQQRLTLASLSASTITLSANVDSVQYPGAKVWLVQRNIAIRNDGTGNLVNLGNQGGNVFRCEVRNTSGTGTTFNSNGFNGGTGHTISGSVSGCSIGISQGNGHTISGSVSGCSIGIYQSTGHIISGSVSGCNNGVSQGTGHTISGSVSGCSTGISSGSGHTISGSVSGCSNGTYLGTGHIISGSVSGCSTGIYSGTGHTISGSVSGCSIGISQGNGHTISGKIGFNSDNIVSSNLYDFYTDPSFGGNWISIGAKLPNSILFQSRNVAIKDVWSGLFCENYGQVLGASYAFQPNGDVIKNTSILRTGGASSSLECIPLSHCSIYGPVGILRWTEFNVPASSQTRKIYILGSGWSSFPTASELYFEAEYLSSGSDVSTTVIASTAVLTDNTTWTAFTVNFTPLQVGIVRYRAYLKKYEAACKVYVDSKLY